MDKLRNYLAKVNEWIGAHWKLVIWSLVAVIMMQQCTINRLQWEVSQLTQGVAVQNELRNEPAVVSIPTDSIAAAGDTTATSTPTVLTGPATEHASHNGWIIALIIVLLVCGVIAYLYMRRNGIYPIGTSIRGKLKNNGGRISYWIRIKNNSRIQIEVAEPLVYFVLGGSSRKFRANVPQLPLTLEPGTSFETEINLSGLISANMELCNAKAIGMSVSTNGKRHNTLPTPVRIKTA